MRLLKSKEAAATVDVRTWPTIVDTGRCHHAIGVHAGLHQAHLFPCVVVGIALSPPKGAEVNGEEAAKRSLLPCSHPLGLGT